MVETVRPFAVAKSEPPMSVDAFVTKAVSSLSAMLLGLLLAFIHFR